jgi:hypothetical protein
MYDACIISRPHSQTVTGIWNEAEQLKKLYTVDFADPVKKSHSPHVEKGQKKEKHRRAPEKGGEHREIRQIEMYRSPADKIEDTFSVQQAFEVISLIENLSTWIRAQDTIAEYRRAQQEALFTPTNITFAQVSQKSRSSLRKQAPETTQSCENWPSRVGRTILL